MRKVVILSGISGSGKSTYVQKLIAEAGMDTYISVVSADKFFMKDGVYKFDPTKLSDAHGACFHEFIFSLQSGEELVIVDNTNTTSEEIAPYILGAQAFKYEVEIITLRIPTLYAHRRNVHGVSAQGVEAQFRRLNERKLPPWWKNTDIQAEGFTMAKAVGQ